MHFSSLPCVPHVVPISCALFNDGLVISAEECNSFSSVLNSFIHPLLTSSILDPNISLPSTSCKFIHLYTSQPLRFYIANRKKKFWTEWQQEFQEFYLVSIFRAWNVDLLFLFLLLLLSSSSSSLSFPKTSISPHLKKNTIYLDAVVLFCVLSTRYEGTLSSVTFCF